MGGGSSKTTKKKIVKNAVQQNWESIDNKENYRVVRNRTDGRQAEQYEYVLGNRYDPSGQAHIYQRRNKTSLPIVRAFEHQWEAKGKGSIPKNNFRVVTERLPHRVSDCPQLSFDQTLYLLDSSLEGYKFLYRNVGPFDVNSNMIGFTPEGQVRVWHNENFGINYPLHQKRTLQSTRNDETHSYDTDYVPLEQIQMVRNIINVIQDRCEQGQFPEPFRHTIRQNIGFNQARKIISEQLDSPERARINRIDLLRNLVKSRVSKNNSQLIGHTNHSYSQFPINTTTSFIQTNIPSLGYNTGQQYRSNYIPTNQPAKNAFSFNYQKPTVS